MSVEEHELFIDSVDSKHTQESWMTPLQVNGNIIPLKLDTGADVNVLPMIEFEKLPSRSRLRSRSDVRLKAYNAGAIPVSGQVILTISHKGHDYKTMFTVSPENVKPILGRKSCETLGLIKLVLAVEQEHKNIEPLDKSTVETEYSDLFTGLGCLPDKVKIELKSDAEPVVEACRKIPFALHDQLKVELDYMEKINVIQKIDKPVEWVNSLVVVHKPNGKLRVCLDPRNLNKFIKREHYKLPTREEIMSRFEGATIFSKLDAASGFWQIQLEDESADLCTFITPFGRYRFNRLPFGISSAPEIYHRIIHNLFQDIPGVDTSMDDIIIWEKNRQEHDERVRAVLQKARNSNLKLNKEKCEIGVNSLTFLGDTITSEGVKPYPRKVEAIVDMERPTNRKELQRFLAW
ncbi:uncharacterized protein K02A2.6-like [Pecten maximus]|uniref:uncharacterized protein K02A2.6-like n=1 Tax=Pecten maximus TaxID=6579 RepID=UPI001457E7DE|nr:uncharacterized protein K02A2.6-like [Pecten maximus]